MVTVPGLGEDVFVDVVDGEGVLVLVVTEAPGSGEDVFVDGVLLILVTEVPGVAGARGSVVLVELLLERN